MGVKPMCNAAAAAFGGRAGHSDAEDGSVNVGLFPQKAMAGTAKPNPQLRIIIDGRHSHATRGNVQLDPEVAGA